MATAQPDQDSNRLAVVDRAGYIARQEGTAYRGCGDWSGILARSSSLHCNELSPRSVFRPVLRRIERLDEVGGVRFESGHADDQPGAVVRGSYGDPDSDAEIFRTACAGQANGPAGGDL